MCQAGWRAPLSLSWRVTAFLSLTLGPEAYFPSTEQLEARQMESNWFLSQRQQSGDGDPLSSATRASCYACNKLFTKEPGWCTEQSPVRRERAPGRGRRRAQPAVRSGGRCSPQGPSLHDQPAAMRKENTTQDHQPKGALPADHCAKTWGGAAGPSAKV